MLYTDDNPIGGIDFEAKVKLLAEIDAYARATEPSLRQVSASLAASWQVVEIIRADGQRVADVRPLVRLNVTPTERTVLIEDGKLVGLMQDRMNARLMGMRPTGNGRRQSHAHQPLPRMTNTIMLAGNRHPDEIIGSVKRGLYAVNFGGGQVDITSGKFVFSCTEAYMIEDGRVGAPVKGATLIGAGAEALKRIGMIGNDLELDLGVGTCGKEGQEVPVGRRTADVATRLADGRRHTGLTNPEGSCTLVVTIVSL